MALRIERTNNRLAVCLKAIPMITIKSAINNPMPIYKIWEQGRALQLVAHLRTCNPVDNKASQKCYEFFSTILPEKPILLKVFAIFIFLFFSGLTADNLTAKETASAGAKFATINKSLLTHDKEAKQLKKELALSLERARKIESPDETQSTITETLENANDWLTQIPRSIENTKNYINILGNVEKLTAITQKKMDKSIDHILAKNIKLLSVDELNNINNQVVLDLENERIHRNDLEQQLTNLNDRREKIVSEISKFSTRLTSSKQSQPLNVFAEAKESIYPKNSELVNKIELLFINQKLLELGLEQQSFDIRRNTLRTERQLAEKNVLSYEKNAAIIQETLNLARTTAATESIASAEIASKKIGRSHPILQKVLKINQNLAAESAEISVNITALSSDKQAIEQELERQYQSFNTIKDKVSSTGLSETIGIRLRNAKNLLPDLSTYSRRLKERRKEIEKIQLRRIELEDQSLELVNISNEVNILLSEATFTSKVEKKNIKNQLLQILEERKTEFLPNILKIYDNYFEKILIPLFEKEKEYVKLISEYNTFINERILWVKSSQVFSYHDLIQSIKSLTWLINPTSWAVIFSHLVSIAKHNVFITTLVSLLFISVFFVRHLLVKKLKYFGRYKTKLSLARFSESILAGIISLLLAAYWPALLWVIALSIDNSPTAAVFTRAVAEGLFSTANVLFFVFLFMQIVRDSGLAESHFRWKVDTIELIKHQLIWFGSLVIPFVFILQITNNQPIQTHFDGLGRLAFICITLLLTVLIYKLVNPKNGIFKDELELHKEGWLNRTRIIWLSLMLMPPLALAITAITGYLYTATELMLLMISSFWIIIIAMILHEFLIRWLNIVQRKLALEQARKKIVANTESENTGPLNDPASLANNDEIELDLGHVSHQTLKLLNNFTGLAVIIGLYLLWSDILPALNMLQNITLWESISTSTDGKIESTTISLANGLTSLFIILVTALIGTNIPGLLEIAVLQRLPFTPSARYGITTIARYIIIIIGILLSFSAIGIGWSKVQWLAAAVTVGLGFGLQEIFANFVSGIIILIERQIRVGDAVTVGDISGRVSRIKMRATTVVDWDRKELIIPNKEFVTGQVINWTLSDTIIRLVIPIGIAYGSDTTKAHDLLLKIARENEFVLVDPEPEAFFAGFGESSLDFELRVFLPTSDLRISTRHNLLMQIDQAFRDENIEIAFPQRDLHIRSMPENTSLQDKKF